MFDARSSRAPLALRTADPHSRPSAGDPELGEKSTTGVSPDRFSGGLRKACRTPGSRTSARYESRPGVKLPHERPASADARTSPGLARPPVRPPRRRVTESAPSASVLPFSSLGLPEARDLL